MVIGPRRLGLFVIVLALAADAHSAQVFLTPDDDVQAAINALQPGDTLVLAPGNYSAKPNLLGRLVVRDKNAYFGEPYRSYAREHDDPSMWIVIRAQDPNDRPVFIFSDSPLNNVINIYNSAFVKLMGLDASGGDDALKLNDSTNQHHIVIENCYLHDIGSIALGVQRGGQSLTIRHNELTRTGNDGELMYLGGSDYLQPLTDSLIEFNYGHYTLNCHQGDGIEIKGGGARNVARYNHIHDVKYPGIMAYGSDGPWSDRNIIYGNIIRHSLDAGIAIRGNAEVYNNLVIDCYRSFFAQVDVNRPAWFRDIVAYNNTFYMASDKPVHLAPGFQSDSSNAFFNNAAYGSTTPSLPAPNGADIKDNVLGDYTAALAAFVSPSADPATFDFYPKSGSILIDSAGAGAPGVDMDNVARGSAIDVGAYERVLDKSNALGLVEGFRTFVTVGIDSPARHQQVSGDVLLTGTATALSEPQVKRVEVSLNAGPWTTASGTASWSRTFNSEDLPSGLVVAEARGVFDLDGGESYSRSASVQLFVVNEPATEITLDLRPEIEDAYVNQASPATNYGSVATIYDASSGRFTVLRVPELPDIPANATVTSARLFIRTSSMSASSTFSRYHLLEKDWEESTVTYNTFDYGIDVGAEVDTLAYADYAGRWVVLEIKDYVECVRAGLPNHGIISQPNDYYYAAYRSMEALRPEERPFLRVTFELDPDGAADNNGGGGCGGSGCGPVDGAGGIGYLVLALAVWLGGRRQVRLCRN